MANGLLSGCCTMDKTLPKRHCHFLLVMWRSRNPALTLMGAKWGVDARISVIR